MNYGKYFKKMRLEKKQTIAEVASGIMSIALLSKFERGLCEITVSKFIKILKRINVTLSEFELIVNNFKKNSLDQLIDSLKEHYNNRLYDEVELIVSNEFNRWKETGNIRYRYNYTMLSIISDDLNDRQTTSQADIEALTDYLFSIEDWTYYELILYGNSLSAIKTNAMILLSNEVLHKTSYFQNNTTHRRMVIQTLLNTAIVCLLKNELDASQRFQHDVAQLITSETFLYEKNILLYCEGLYLFRKNQCKAGKEKIETALTIFKQLGCHNLATSYSTYFDFIQQLDN